MVERLHQALVGEHHGREVELDVGRVDALARAPEAAGLGDVGRQRAAALGLQERDVLLRLGRLERRRVVGEEDDPGVEVVLEVAADLGLVDQHVDPVAAELVARADAGEHQQLRRLVGAGAEDDLLRRLQRGRRAVDDGLDARCARAVEQHAGHERHRDQRQVRARQRGVEVGHRGRAAHAVALRHLVAADAVLLAGVEVLDLAEPGRRGGVDEGVRERVHGVRVRDGQRPAGAVELRRAALVVLGALEVGQHVVPAPARVAEVAPLVVVAAVAADVDHRVQRGGAAEHAAAREVDAAAVERGLGLGCEVPVEGRLVELGEGDRDVQAVLGVRRAGLDEADGAVRVLGQAVGQHAAGRAGADDHVVVHGPILAGRRRQRNR